MGTDVRKKELTKLVICLVNIKMCTDPKETLTYKIGVYEEDAHCCAGCKNKNL